MKQQTMKAWQLDRFGLGNLAWVDRQIPRPGADEVVVRVGAVSLNYRDLMVVDGQLLPKPPTMPFVPVSDFAGEIAAVGAGVRHPSLGDRVMGNFWVDWIDGVPPKDMAIDGRSLGGPMQGALAEFVTVPAHAAVRSPDNLSDAEAATLPVAPLTAWFALTEAGRTQQDDIVVVQGTGGVALAGLQFAKALGARVVVTSRSEHKLSKVAALGPWQTIDTRVHTDWAARVRELTGDTGANHVLEIIGGDNVARSAEALATEGRISLIGFLAGGEFQLGAVPLMLKRASIKGVSVGHRQAFDSMVRFIEARDIHPVIDSLFESRDAPAAFARLSAGPAGKVVIDMSR